MTAPSVPVVGLAHGSRHPGVVSSIAGLMAAVAGLGSVPSAAAFLDLTEPDLMQVAGGLARDGCTCAVVVPLLFTSAFHATVDVPQTVRAAADRFGLDLVVADILGTGDDVLAVLAGSAAAAGIAADQPMLLYAVGSSDGAANDAVHHLAARLARTRTAAVRAGFGTSSPTGADVAAELAEAGKPIAVLPLFLAPGLLLDPMASLARDRGWTLAPPLGTRAAPLVWQRYLNAVSRQPRRR